MPEPTKSTQTNAHKGRGSYKPEAVQTRIIAKKLVGKSNRTIAKEEGIDQHTVARVLSQSQFREIVQAHREQVLGLVPRSIAVFEKTLKGALGEETLPSEPTNAEEIAVLDRGDLQRRLDAAYRRGVAAGMDGTKVASDVLKGMQVLVGKQETDVTLQDEVQKLSDEERQTRIAAYLARMGKKE